MANSNHISWMSSPDVRGTLQIFWGCFTTLALCVWTAVHPNIQWQPDRKKSDFSIRILMMITAIVFPEVLISAAWRQREQVKYLRGIIARHVSHPLSPTDSGRTKTFGLVPECQQGSDESNTSSMNLQRHDGAIKTIPCLWTDKEAYFAVMGGLVIEHEIAGTQGIHRGLRYIVTPDGIDLLMLANAPLSISLEEIEERDNADSIAKLIVIGQVLWFVVQIAARMTQSLPVTALEVHTTVHVGCALLMYLIWWSKPYNLTKPIFLSDPISKSVGALMICKDAVARIHEKKLADYDRALEKYWQERALTAARGEDLEDDLLLPSEPRRIGLEEFLDLYLSRDVKSLLDPDMADEEGTLASLAAEARRGLERLKDKSSPCYASNIEDYEQVIRQSSDNFTIQDVWGAWSSDVGHELSLAKLLHFLFTSLYGGAHLLARDSDSFPTTAELWLWRSSAIMIASVWLWGTIWILFWKATRSSSRWLSSFRNGEFEIFFGPLFCTIIVAFALARCYLFVESIASLRSLPAEAYTEISWTGFLPHSN